MAKVKVVVLGGSGVATPELAEAIARTPGRTEAIDLVLVGRSAGKLEQVANVARLLSDNDPLLEISHTTDLDSALTGANYVINQIRVGGLQARAFDESFPLELGLPGEETVGPGGFANASRTIPVVLEYARRMEQICPDAVMLSFANPSSLVQYAVTSYTRVRTIGLCDSPISLSRSIATALGAPLEELTIDYVGMHHFGWVTGIWWRGRDVLPEALERASQIAPDVEPGIVQTIGAIPGAYLNYVFHPDRMLARKIGKRPRAEELLELQDEILADYAASVTSGERPTAIERRKARWYEAIIAPVLVALIEGATGTPGARPGQFILNLVNGGAISWLPADAVVELPAILDHGQVRPLAPGMVPPDVRVLIQRNCTYEMLAVRAIVERDRALAIRALLLNPIIHTYDQAAAVLEQAWTGP